MTINHNDFLANGAGAKEDATRLQAALDDAAAGPTDAALENAPTLDDYVLVSAPYELRPMLVGNTNAHPVLGCGVVSTSALVYFDPDKGVARTQSRWYRLGLPAATDVSKRSHVMQVTLSQLNEAPLKEFYLMIQAERKLLALEIKRLTY